MTDKNEMKKDAESWPPLSYSGSWRNESIDTVFITTAMGMWFHDYPRQTGATCSDQESGD